MQTSAKTKAKEFMKTWGLTSEDDKVLLNSLTNLLVEHERDTRYTAIDVLNSMETHSLQIEDTLFEERYVWVDGVELDEAVRLIHKSSVGLS